MQCVLCGCIYVMIQWSHVYVNTRELQPSILHLLLQVVSEVMSRDLKMEVDDELMQAAKHWEQIYWLPARCTVLKVRARERERENVKQQLRQFKDFSAGVCVGWLRRYLPVAVDVGLPQGSCALWCPACVYIKLSLWSRQALLLTNQCILGKMSLRSNLSRTHEALCWVHDCEFCKA